MEVIVLKQRLKGVQPLFSNTPTPTPEEDEHEMSMLLGEHLDEEGFNRELKAHTDRIRILETELQRARSEAYQTGFMEGQRIAEAEAQKKFNHSTQEFSKTVHTIHNEFTTVIEKLAEPVLHLALGAAERIVQRELTLDDHSNQVLIAQVQRILNETATQTRAVIQVNSAQLEWITGSEVLNQLNIPQKGNLRFIPNPKLGPGECLLETEDYLVDGTIHSQLNQLEKALKESDATDSI